MAERFGPFDGGAGASITEDDWTAIIRSGTRSGVVPGGTITGSTPTARTPSDPALKATASGLTWTLPTGRAVIEGIGYENNSSLTRSGTANNNSSARIDRLVLRCDRSANTVTATVLTGTPGSSTPPALVATATVHDLPLARATLPGNSSSYGTLVDERPFTGAQHIAQPAAGLGIIAPGDLHVVTNEDAGAPYLRGTDNVSRRLALLQGAAYHGWRLVGGQIAHAPVGGAYFNLSSSLGVDSGVQAGIATLSSTGLRLNRAGLWSLLFYGGSNTVHNGYSALALGWIGGAWTRTFDSLISQVSRVHSVDEGGQLYQQVKWDGYVTAAQAGQPIVPSVKQANVGAATVPYDFFLTAELCAA